MTPEETSEQEDKGRLFVSYPIGVIAKQARTTLLNELIEEVERGGKVTTYPEDGRYDNIKDVLEDWYNNHIKPQVLTLLKSKL